MALASVTVHTSLKSRNFRAEPSLVEPLGLLHDGKITAARSVEPADQQGHWSVTPDLGSAAQQTGAMALAPPVKLAGPAYATALEQAMAEQQREIALSRNEIEAARQEALQARRSEEHTKTELINARAKFAMDVAEIRRRRAGTRRPVRAPRRGREETRRCC